MSVSLVGLRRRLHRLPLAEARWRLRLQDHGRQGRRRPRRDPGQRQLLLPRRGPHVADRSTRPRRCRRPRRSTRAPILDGHEGRDRGALPEVRPPRLPGAVCATSQWFECPCHGSQYNRVGEKKGGPAPRGIDRFAVSIVERQRHRRHGRHHPRPPIGTNTTGQEAEGPHCITAAGALMVYATAATHDRRDRHPVDPHRRRGSCTCSGTCATPGPRSAPSSSWPRTASPTTTTRSSRAPSSSGTQIFGVAMLVVIGVGLPLYWIAEPGRQAGAVARLQQAVRRVGLAATSTPPPTAASTAPAATAA